MKFVRNAIIFAKRTPVKVWLFAIVVPGGLVGVTLWISAKSLYRVLKKRHDKNTISG